jgi:predicted transcriptional regulator
MSITSVRLPEDLSARVEELAAKLQRSKSWIINEALRDYVERAEGDAQRWRETLKALDSVRAGKLIDGDTVDKWIASWGTDKELPPPR